MCGLHLSSSLGLQLRGEVAERKDFMDPIITCWTLVESLQTETCIKETMEKPARACGQPTADGSTAGRKPQALLGAGLALARGLAMALADVSAQRLH